MTTPEMHVAFRQYAQQMGMQNNRAILPEQIDILLNQSITDTVNSIVRENIGVTNDRVLTDNSKIGQINALRTLFYPKEFTFKKYANDESDKLQGDVSFYFDPRHRRQGLIKHTYLQVTPRPGEPTLDEDVLFGKYMFLVDISICYKSTTLGDNDNEELITAWYPVRIIDSSFLADTLNDFILKNRFRSPVACIYRNDTLELYIDKFKAVDVPAEGNSPAYQKPVFEIPANVGIELEPYKLRLNLIKFPNVVQYVDDLTDDNTKNVDCDLPENMHGDIVKHAVDLYRASLTGSIQAAQAAEQNQQMENVRNNYRNEGNQN